MIEGYHYIPTLNGFHLALLAVLYGLVRTLLKSPRRR